MKFDNTPLADIKDGGDLKPTQEQQEIIDAAINDNYNMAVEARAGAAKTTTLVMLAENLPNEDILCLAFNKSIAGEMTERLPSNCDAKTFHSLGYKAWINFVQKNCRVDFKKVFTLLKAQIELIQDNEARTAAYNCMAETLDFINKGKSAGYLPDSYEGHWTPLIGDYTFFSNLPVEPSMMQEQLVKQVSIASFKLALKGVLDFNDMVLCATICPVHFPSPSLLLVDEAQDLSPLNHVMIKKITRGARIIAVGDPCQAIYGFRGADTESMNLLKKMFQMETFYLTTSFRCSRAVVENAQWRAPDMNAPEWAEQGYVDKKTLTWDADLLDDFNAVICRNNAPLFNLAIKLIKNGRMPELAGRDIAAGLLKVMKKLGKPNLEQAAALDALAEYEEKEIRRAREGAELAIRDRSECIRIMLKQTESLGDAMAYLNDLLAREGRIKLMTGHKSKGLEFDHVFFLDQDLCRIKYDQDANIKYVIETRAKISLTYVEIKNFIDHTSEGEEEDAA